MKKEGPRNIGTVDGDIVALATIEAPDMANYYLKPDISIIRRKHGGSYRNVGWVTR